MTVELNNGILEHKVGEMYIRKEQADCSQEIFNVFKRYEGPPILIAQMQQGKTDVCIDVIDKFIRHCEDTNKKYEIIYLINIADNVLKEQTENRLLQAGVLSYVKDEEVIHHAQLKKNSVFCPNMNVDYRLIVVDECHIALDKSKEDDFKPFHEFLKKCGIDYGKSINTWKNKNNYVLSVSATPYAQIIASKIYNGSFKPVVLEVSNDYYSIQQMKDDNRFFQSQQVVKKIGKNKEITPFFIERLDEFLNKCDTEGVGHLVVRATGEAPKLLKEYINRNSSKLLKNHSNYKNISVKIFESRPKNNIGRIDDHLSRKYPNPFIAIIRGSLRAGKTLTTTEHIRMWLEPPTSKTDTMCQVVGRCLGYEMIDGNNRRTNDAFPVYCNIKELDVAIDFFDEQKCIPNGRNTTYAAISGYQIEIEEINEDFETARSRYLKKGETLYKTSQQFSRNPFREILNGSAESYPGTTQHNYHWYVDGMCLEKEHDSVIARCSYEERSKDYDLVKQKYPNSVGNIIRFKRDCPKIKHENNQIKPGTMLV